MPRAGGRAAQITSAACSVRQAFARCFVFQAEGGIRDLTVTGVQTCALPILIIVFAIGVAAGIALVEALRRRSAPAPAARVLGVEGVLLLGFMLVGRIVLDGQSATGGSWDYYLLAVLAVLAMGWQNAALRRVAGVPVHTTFVTGILTHLAEESVNGWYAWRDLRRGGTPPRPPHRGRTGEGRVGEKGGTRGVPCR